LTDPLSGPHIEVVIAPDAPARMGAYARRQRHRGVLLVMDANTRVAAGEALTSALDETGVRSEEFVFEEREGLLPGNNEVARVRARLSAEALPVAVGSGVITDIVRYAAHLSDRDFVSVPTAASMDGYASSVAAMQIDGVRLTYPARAPQALFADPGVLAAAPAELTRAGLGDLLGKATAGVDWLAAHLLLGELYSEEVAARVLGPLQWAAENADRVLTGDRDAAQGLLVGLVESGVAMAMLGHSRPASGCEHHASHFWDLLAARGLRAHASHGLQVGYATRFAMRLQRFAFAGGVGALRPPRPPADPLDAAARRWLGDPVPDGIVAAVRDKHRWSEANADRWPRNAVQWEGVLTQLGPSLERFVAVEKALTQAGIPPDPGYLDIDQQTLRATFRYASRLRARYTALDFLEGQGVLEQAIEAEIL
jgi:glycerol-1-phosphate dehydrogenase [NAD(P)+]